MADKVTLAQVAKQAGVSLSAASMILNEKQGVSFQKETVDKVFQAATALGYVRNLSKKSLPFQKKVIAVLLPTVTGHYYTSITQVISQFANQAGYDSINYETHRNEARELRGLKYLEKCGPAGIICTYIPQCYKELERISKTIPVVVIGKRKSDLHVDMVETDNWRAGALLANHMLDLGHRHVAFLMVERHWQGFTSNHRLTGAKETFDACPDALLTVKSRPAPDTLEPGCMLNSCELGRQMALECLDDPTITGFICVNDYIAYGVLDALAERGLSAPDDYSVCGCDNIFSSKLARISLTSVSHHSYTIGKNACEMLVRQITTPRDDKHPESIMRMEFLSTLIVRSSTGKPRKI